MLEHGQWGSVCDDTWDLEDAHVVCRQLNCGWAVQALPGLHFAPGRGLIHRDQVNCSGAEDYLWDCPGLHGDRYCGHKEDAGVVCSGQWATGLNLGPPPTLTVSLLGTRPVVSAGEVVLVWSLSRREDDTQTNVNPGKAW